MTVKLASGPRLFRQAGCGCVYIDLGNRETITVDYCGSDGSDGPKYWFGRRNNVSPENLTENFLTAEAHERIFNEINRLMLLGTRLEDVQRALGIQVTR